MSVLCILVQRNVQYQTDNSFSQSQYNIRPLMPFFLATRSNHENYYHFFRDAGTTGAFAPVGFCLHNFTGALQQFVQHGTETGIHAYN